jgi:multidrug efflux pump
VVQKILLAVVSVKLKVASVRDAERTLIASVVLVILIVFVFLRSARITLIPTVAVPVSLIGTSGTMYLLDYSIDICR